MNRHKAFTLVELLVVIAIIAVLMSILMPSLQRVRKQAKDTICRSRLHQWGLIFTLYTDDNEGYFNEGWDVGTRALWPVALLPYHRDSKELLLCPMATKLLSRHGQGPFASWERSFPVQGEPDIDVISSYTINSWTNNMTKNRGSRKEIWFWKSTNNIKNRSNVPVFGDGTWNDAWPRHNDDPPPTDGAWGGSGGSSVTGEMAHFCLNRHIKGSINMLFADWSVRNTGLKELWTLKWHRGFETNGPWTLGGNVRTSMWPEWMRSLRDY